MKLSDVVIFVVGGNNCWGKGATLPIALQNACNPKQWQAFIAHKSVGMDGMGFVWWEGEDEPREIARRGIRGKNNKGFISFREKAEEVK